jgi:ATP-dependent RNA helicase SUPV3L1/SUV3
MPGQGLTSAPLDPAVPRPLYRVAGFRQCGPRVVRIDMVERLADMIRPRVFWKPQRPEEPRPQGSVPGGGFTPTPEMMSLVGCSGEEFAGILRSLGYRSARRPAPPEPAAPAQAVPEAGPDASPGPTAAAVHACPPAVAGAPGDPMPEAPAPSAAEPQGNLPEAAAPAQALPDEQERSVLPPAGDADAGQRPAGAEAPRAAEPRMIEVWWPKETGPFRRDRREDRRAQGRARPPREGARSDKALGEGQRHDRPHRRRPRPGKPQADEAAAAAGTPEAPQADAPTPARPEERKERRPDRAPRKPRPVETSHADSPFAVLQALKAELVRRKS